ncbi:MAG: hypothetical protein ACYTGB_09430 [Planctomycetota bacterium]|jgi:hypothetical protein
MDTRQLQRLCQSFRLKLRALVMRSGVCRVLTLGLLVLPPLLALDWWVHLGTAWRLLLLPLYLAMLGAAAWWTLLAPLRRSWSDQEVLSFLDSVLPAEQDMLLELYQLSRGEGIQETESEKGRQLVEDAVRDLAPLVSQVRAGSGLEGRRARFWLQTAGLVVLVVVAAAAHPGLRQHMLIGCERFFNPFSRTRWPHRTTITLEQPQTGWTIPQMESFTVKGKVTGSLVPPQVTLAYRGKSGGYWIKERISVRDDGSIRYTFPEVREAIRFYVHGGDYETDMMRISIVERPFLKRILADYDYPDYAGIPDRPVEGGQLVGLEGTKVKLSFESSMPLKKAVFVLREGKAEEKREEFKLDGGTKFGKELYLSEDGNYQIELYEVNGFREAKPERYEIRVTPDDPPEVELLSPGRNLTGTNEATVEVALRTKDDFGVKKVEFLYSVDDAKPAPLTDRVTGPLDPKGRKSPPEVRFTWDLRKMKLPKTGLLRYFVRVTDVNPTGKGVAETAPLEIKLVKRSQFHFSIFEQAKRIEAEARIAWENQYVAWELGRQWPAKGSGKEDDPVWAEMREKQDLAVRAAKAMENYLLDLTEQYEKNDMSRDFMAGRLAVIADLLRQVTATEHPAIVNGLRAARPKTDADAVPARLKGLRGSSLKKFTSNQKMATLHLERLVKRLFDWRDLQTTLIRTTLLHEEQDEVLAITKELAPKTLGMELEDLADEVQDRLITLGKRQRTLFDVETELEKELEFQIYRAEQQKRRSILAALRTAYKGLRVNRVNDNLKVAAKKIENNQAFQIVKNQTAALQILNVVKGGLIHAGQKVDPEPKITLAMVPSKIIDVRPKPRTEDGTEEEPTDVAGVDDVEALTPEELLANLPVGSDPVTMAINVAWESQDAVHARTKYLAANSGPQEMPRYVRMKQGILIEKQDGALRVLDMAIGAAKKTEPGPVSNSLQAVKGDFTQSRRLIGERLLGKGVQQLQADSMGSLDDLRRRYLPLKKSVAESVEENRKRKGLDAFNRQFLLRGEDLNKAEAVIGRLNHLQLLERDVLRKLERFSQHPPKAKARAEMEKSNRELAAKAHEAAVKLLSEVGAEFGGLSEETRPQVAEAGVDPLMKIKPGGWAADIRGGAKDAELVDSVKAAAGLLDKTLTALKDLLGERVKPKVAATQETEAPPEVTLEEWEKMRSPESLRERIKNAKGLPPEVRDIMLRALSGEFPEKYRDLLVDYYASFIGGAASGKDQGEKDEGGKKGGEK